MIGDKAENAGDGDDVRVGSDIRGLYRLESMEEVPADEIGTDEFPKYGDFLRVHDVEQGVDCFIAHYVALDEELVEIVDDAGDTFRVLECYKTGDGGYSVKAVDPE